MSTYYDMDGQPQRITGTFRYGRQDEGAGKREGESASSDSYDYELPEGYIWSR